MPRTFFNYFSCKEEAVVGLEPALLREIAREVEARPANEDPFTALLAVLAADEDSELARRWMIRTALSARYPRLIPRHMAAVVELERALTCAIATRIGADPNTDPFPKLIVAWSVATLRATIEWWHASEQPRPLRTALEEAFSVLADGVAAHAMDDVS